MRDILQCRVRTTETQTETRKDRERQTIYRQTDAVRQNNRHRQRSRQIRSQTVMQTDRDTDAVADRHDLIHVAFFERVGAIGNRHSFITEIYIAPLQGYYSEAPE